MFLFKTGERSSKLQGERDVSQANLSAEVQMRRTEKIQTDKLVSRAMMHYSWGKHFLYFQLQKSSRKKTARDLSTFPVTTFILFAISRTRNKRYIKRK